MTSISIICIGSVSSSIDVDNKAMMSCHLWFHNRYLYWVANLKASWFWNHFKYISSWSH